MSSMGIQWSLVIFSTLAGTGAWLLVFLGISELKGCVKESKTKMIAALLAVVLMVLGGLASATHLSHPDRIMAALGHPTSGIFMEALFIGLTCVAAIIYIVMVKRQASASTTKVVVCITALIALVLTFVLGYSYIIPARPMWDTVLLPLGYMATAASGGGACLMLAFALGKEGEKTVSFAATLMIAGAALALVLSLAYGAVSGALSADGVLALWVVAVAGTALVPGVGGLLVRAKPNQAMAWAIVSLVAALAGCAAFRCIMWLVGAGVRDFFEIPLH